MKARVACLLKHRPSNLTGGLQEDAAGTPPRLLLLQIDFSVPKFQHGFGGLSVVMRFRSRFFTCKATLPAEVRARSFQKVHLLRRERDHA